MDAVDGIFMLLFCILTLICGLAVTDHFWRKKHMAAIDTLNANIAKLKTDVEAFIASHTTNSEAQIQAAADAVAAVDAEVLAATPAPTA